MATCGHKKGLSRHLKTYEGKGGIHCFCCSLWGKPAKAKPKISRAIRRASKIKIATEDYLDEIEDDYSDLMVD